MAYECFRDLRRRPLAELADPVVHASRHVPAGPASISAVRKARIRRWIAAQSARVRAGVEGPASFDAAHSASGRSGMPVAGRLLHVLSSIASKSAREDRSRGPSVAPPGSLFFGFYPMCDYSPEMAALRDGRAAALGFRSSSISIATASRSSGPREALPPCPPEDEPPQRELLADDPHLAHSRYLKELASRLGCRDFNEIWDHVFEAAHDLDDDAFVDRLLDVLRLCPAPSIRRRICGPTGPRPAKRAWPPPSARSWSATVPRNGAG